MKTQHIFWQILRPIWGIVLLWMAMSYIFEKLIPVENLKYLSQPTEVIDKVKPKQSKGIRNLHFDPEILGRNKQLNNTLEL